MAELWKELHIRALANKGKNETEYLKEFAEKIPRYTQGCKCREFWVIWIKSNPPRFGTKGEFFEWTVKAHNQVNKKLKKPEYTIQQAKAYYSKLK